MTNPSHTELAARKALHLLKRYASETPLGHQPHMIALEAAEAIEQLSAALESPERVGGEHRPGCDALGGYGHGVGPCSCAAAPSPQAEKQPLSEALILTRPDTGSQPGTIAYDIDLARFVERAHGIVTKESTNE